MNDFPPYQNLLIQDSAHLLWCLIHGFNVGSGIPFTIVNF